MKLWYAVQNNGDGSASTLFFRSEQDAEAFEEKQDEPFAESSIGCIKIDGTVDESIYYEADEDFDE